MIKKWDLRPVLNELDSDALNARGLMWCRRRVRTEALHCDERVGIVGIIPRTALLIRL